MLQCVEIRLVKHSFSLKMENIVIRIKHSLKMETIIISL